MDPRIFGSIFEGRYGRYCGRALQLEFRRKATIVVSASTSITPPRPRTLESVHECTPYRTDEIQRGSSINDPKFTRNRILRDSARLSLCQYVAEERRSFFELPRFPSFRECGIVDYWTSRDHFVSLLIGNASSNNQPVPFTIDRSADRDYPCVPLG